jgi:transcriptional regulator with XRE-family HTH domain
MNALSDTLRELMDRHDLTGVKLAEEIGISTVSVSNILTGKSRPRQVTLSRMMKRLCETPEDEQTLLSAYESLSGEKVPVSPVVDDGQNAATEEERARRFMEMKAKSISFRKEVALKLYETKLRFQQEYTRGNVTTDFLIEDAGKRIALECRSNVRRDLEKSLTSARIIRDELKCDQVFIVVPEPDDDLRNALAKEKSIHAVVLWDLFKKINSISDL